MKGKIRFVVCLIMEDDTKKNSERLRRTIHSIENNIYSFKGMNLDSKNILVCIFFKKIIGKEIFNKRDYVNLKDINSYIIVKKKYNLEDNNNKNIKVHCISKIDYLTEIEIFKCFYCMIIKN